VNNNAVKDKWLFEEARENTEAQAHMPRLKSPTPPLFNALSWMYCT